MRAFTAANTGVQYSFEANLMKNEHQPGRHRAIFDRGEFKTIFWCEIVQLEALWDTRARALTIIFSSFQVILGHLEAGRNMYRERERHQNCYQGKGFHFSIDRPRIHVNRRTTMHAKEFTRYMQPTEVHRLRVYCANPRFVISVSE